MYSDDSHPGLQSIHGADVPVLIVEDNAQSAMVLQRLLEGAFGYRNITCVDETQKAYDLIVAKPDGFRLLFVDNNFPSGDHGTELLQKLSVEKLLLNKIAFLVTADPTIENMTKAQAAGALSLVAKPFNRENLKAQLQLAEQAVIVASTPSF